MREIELASNNPNVFGNIIIILFVVVDPFTRSGVTPVKSWAM